MRPPPRAEPAGSRRPLGVGALTAFFAAGATLNALSAVSLAVPGSPLEPMWRLNPVAREGFARMDGWSVPLMMLVSAACAAAAAGLWRARRWGRWVAAGVLSTNLAGDLLNALLRGDRRTLIGLPIGGAMLAYLFGRQVRRFLDTAAHDRSLGS